MSVLRGKGFGLEVVLDRADVDAAIAELASRIEEQPGFYRGSTATAAFGERLPTDEQFDALLRVLEAGGIALRSIAGSGVIETFARARGLEFVPAAPAAEPFEQRTREKRKREVALSAAARSLVADFAGARADIAQRRKQGDTSVRRQDLRVTGRADPPAALAPVEALPGTLYHVGTLRGGQSLHQVGNIVVVGDVNPGAELVASGDVLVFGRLAGVAHAGAQGDANARVYALVMAPTQLRIATFIAADAAAAATSEAPECALVRDGRIAVVPYEELDRQPREGVR